MTDFYRLVYTILAPFIRFFFPRRVACRWPGSIRFESCSLEANPTQKAKGPGSGSSDGSGIGPEQTLRKRVKQVVA